MDFNSEVKTKKEALSRFIKWWNSAKETGRFQNLTLKDFTTSDFNSQLGYWVEFLDTQNIGISIGTYGYDVYVLDMTKCDIPEFLIFNEEYGYTYLDRKIETEKEIGIIFNYKRAILSALNFIQSTKPQ